MTKVLFVCLGNICRSPTAHGVFAHQVAESGLSDCIRVDSAGTSGWHEGKLPDRRSMKQAADHGYDLSFIRSRKVTSADFVDQDYILAMDRESLKNLQKKICSQEHTHKLRLFLDYADLRAPVSDVPDPYYGGNEGFELGGVALLDHLKKNL